MPRSIEGHGVVRVRYPPPCSIRWPASSTSSAPMPGSGKVADPGLVVVMPGRGAIMMAPVSVCHQVSTTGQLPPPMWSEYHNHASGLLASPTEPSRRRLVRSCLAGSSAPHFMNVRMAVGAQYRMVTPYRSMIDHQRSRPGVSGVPSYITEVAPLASGP